MGVTPVLVLLAANDQVGLQFDQNLQVELGGVTQIHHPQPKCLLQNVPFVERSARGTGKQDAPRAGPDVSPDLWGVGELVSN